MEKAARLALFIFSVIILSSLLVYGDKVKITPPSLPSGGSFFDFAVGVFNAVFSAITQILVIIFNGITFAWIPEPYRYIIALPFWITLIFIVIVFGSEIIDKVTGLIP